MRMMEGARATRSTRREREIRKAVIPVGRRRQPAPKAKAKIHKRI
jgi:hypothetical protein